MSRNREVDPPRKPMGRINGCDASCDPSRRHSNVGNDACNNLADFPNNDIVIGTFSSQMRSGCLSAATTLLSSFGVTCRNRLYRGYRMAMGNVGQKSRVFLTGCLYV